MCQTSLPSDYHVVCKMINDEIPCTVIYSKPYDHGTLYAMILKERTSHRKLSVDLDEVDKGMRVASAPERTRFRSIFMDPFNGKVKTFQKGEHAGDPLYNVIFESKNPGGGRELVSRSGVDIWHPLDLIQENAPDEYDNEETEELAKKGGPCASGTGSKKRSSSSTESGAKRTKMAGASFMEDDDVYSVARKQKESDAEAKKVQAELVKAKADIGSLRSEVEKYKAKATSDDDKIKTLLREKEEYKAKADAADARQGSHSRELSKSKAETARVEAELTGLKQEMETLKAGQVVVSGGGAGDDVALMREFERLKAFEREYNGEQLGVMQDNALLRGEVIVFCLTIVFMCVDLT